MPIWSVPPVSEQPRMKLTSWRVFEIEATGTRHFVGYNVWDREGRVSSAIERFDLEARCGQTRSGRIYELGGPPGFDSDAEYVWRRWQSLNGVASVRDVTDEFSEPASSEPTPKRSK